MQERRCTDLLCLIVFFCYIGFMGWMTIVGMSKGNGGYMMAPIMPGEKVCGYDKGVEDYPALFVPNLKDSLFLPTEFFTYATCVKSCPSSQEDTVECFDQSDCDSYPVYKTHDVYNYCLPSGNAIKEYYEDQGDGGIFNQGNYYLSMFEARWAIISCILIALLVSLFYLKLMDWFAVYIAWITIIVVQIALVVLGFFCYQQSGKVET